MLLGNLLQHPLGALSDPGRGQGLGRLCQLREVGLADKRRSGKWFGTETETDAD